MKKNIVEALKRVLFICLFFSITFSAVTAAAESLNALKEEREFYVEMADEARKAVAEKQAEVTSIQTQISQVEAQINQAEGALQSTLRRIGESERIIREIEGKIKVEEEALAVEQAKMSTVVSAWYMGKQDGLLEAMVGSDSISAAVDKQEAYNAVKDHIEEIEARIKAEQRELIKQKNERVNQLEILESLKHDQEVAKENLNNDKALKDRLLADATSAIADLRAEAREAEAKIVEINTKIQALSVTRSWGDQINSSNDPSWYYMQTGNYTRLGNSPYTISQYGCLITSMAMVAKYYGQDVTPGDIARNGSIFDRGGYLKVTSPPGIGISILPSRPVDWGAINSEIENGRPVIVSVYLPSVGAINSDGSSHFIVIKGKVGSKYLMHDPIGDGRGYNVAQIRSMRLARPY